LALCRMAADDRWQFANILPVTFMIWVVACTWTIHFSFHLLPALQASGMTFKSGLLQWPPHYSYVQAAISQTLAALFFVSLGRAMFTDPGSLPKGTGKAQGSQTFLTTAEVKRTGEPRFCKWCKSHKPDRSHHCRACKACILKMDHHCPWISNCVGFRNHKYFFLVVFYSLSNCFFNMCTMYNTMWRFYEVEAPALSRFMLVFGITTSTVMTCILFPFLAFHIWLMLTATTTIEFCEKSTRYRGKSGEQLGRSRFHVGWYQNTKNVLGPSPFLWLLPLSPPTGDGYSFETSSERSPLIGSPPLSETTALLRPRPEGGLGLGSGSSSEGGITNPLTDESPAKQPVFVGSPEVTGGKAALV